MKIFVLILLAAAIPCVAIRAAEVSPVAGERARLYQSEARNVLIRHGWHVSRNDSGRLVADHPVGLVVDFGGTSRRVGLLDVDTEHFNMFAVSTLAWLTLVFRPETEKRTACTAGIVSYRYGHPNGSVAKKLTGPFPYNGPHSTKEIREMMAEAEAQMASKHPEYAGR